MQCYLATSCLIWNSPDVPSVEAVIVGGIDRHLAQQPENKTFPDYRGRENVLYSYAFVLATSMETCIHSLKFFVGYTQ
jgi:hypothetical protein